MAKYIISHAVDKEQTEKVKAIKAASQRKTQRAGSPVHGPQAHRVKTLKQTRSKNDVKQAQISHLQKLVSKLTDTAKTLPPNEAKPMVVALRARIKKELKRMSRSNNDSKAKAARVLREKLKLAQNQDKRKQKRLKLRKLKEQKQANRMMKKANTSLSKLKDRQKWMPQAQHILDVATAGKAKAQTEAYSGRGKQESAATKRYKKQQAQLMKKALFPSGEVLSLMRPHLTTKRPRKSQRAASKHLSSHHSDVQKKAAKAVKKTLAPMKAEQTAFCTKAAQQLDELKETIQTECLRDVKKASCRRLKSKLKSLKAGVSSAGC